MPAHDAVLALLDWLPEDRDADAALVAELLRIPEVEAARHDRLTRRAHHGTGRWRQQCSGGTPSLSDQATLPWRGVRKDCHVLTRRPRCASSRSRTSRSPA